MAKEKARPQKAHPRASRVPLTVLRTELLIDGSDQEFRRLVHGLFAFLALHTAIRDGYADLLGLGGPQYTILLCIRQLAADEAVSVRTIADHLRLSGSFITVETNKLEKLGLIDKARQSGDRRMVSLKLTMRGNQLLDSIAELRQQVNDIQFGTLSSEEFRNLVPLVYRLIESGERALSLLNFLRSGDNVDGNILRLDRRLKAAIGS